MTHKWIVKGISGSQVQSEGFVEGFFGAELVDSMIAEAQADVQGRSVQQFGGWRVELAIVRDSNDFFNDVMAMNAAGANDRMEWSG